MLNKKSYIIAPLLILAFVILIVSLSFFLNKDINHNKISLELLINRLRFEMLVNEETFLGNLTSIVLNTSTSSFSLEELNQKVNSFLVQKFGNDYGTRIEEENGTLIINAIFSQKIKKWKSVNIPEQTSNITKTLFFPFSGLIKASYDFDLISFENCLKPCNITNYENKINSCLSELETEKILYKTVFSDKPFDSGAVNLSIKVYYKDNNLTQAFPHQVREEKWLLFNCT